jgi:hypothetical protein
MKKRFLPLLLTGALLVACGSSQSTTTSTTSSSTASTASTTTTQLVVATAQKDPQAELDALAISNQAIDYSRISESDCGKYSLVVKKTEILFFQWKNNTWQDQSNLLGSDSEMEPFLVTTHDYTSDDVRDFLVSYNKDGQNGGHQFGGVFLEIDCRWQWAEFVGYGGEITETLDLLDYDKTTKDLIAWDYGPQGRADVIVTFNSQTNQFETMTLSADDVDPEFNQSQSQPSVSVIGVRCQDGLPLSSGCYAVYSNGTTRGIDGYGPWIGNVIASTQFLNAMGDRICVQMYSNGRGKSSYC